MEYLIFPNILCQFLMCDTNILNSLKAHESSFWLNLIKFEILPYNFLLFDFF